MIDESLQTGSLTLGPHGRSLEAAFAQRHDIPHAIAVSSGTSALEIVFRSIGVTGRDVIVPANTFFATAAAVLHAGGVPRFADVDATTLALSVRTVETALTPQTARRRRRAHRRTDHAQKSAALRELCDHVACGSLRMPLTRTAFLQRPTRQGHSALPAHSRSIRRR